MSILWLSLCRLYRLGLCGTLVIVDSLLVIVFFIDVYRFTRAGYETASLQSLPTGHELFRAFLHASETGAFIFVVIPLLVASVRIIVTRLKLPSINWPAKRILIGHSIFTVIIAIGVVTCVRMEVASGLKFNFDSKQLAYVSASYVYHASLESLPLMINDAMIYWLPAYIMSWHFVLLLAGVAVSYFTGRQFFITQRVFLNDYISASKLADCDPSYLPTSTARRVASVRYCAPPTVAIHKSVEHELHAVNFGRNGLSYDHNKLATRVREMVANYLFDDFHHDTTVRILPDTLSCIYSAIRNEEAEVPIVLSSTNHPGINDPVVAWFGKNRKVQILGIDEARRLEVWTVQQAVLLQALTSSFTSEAKVIVVLPLVSFYTGQVFNVKSLIDQVRAWSQNAIVVLDGSFLSITSGSKVGDLCGADYLCLNISQWITCPESCGVLVTKKHLAFDPDWETQVGCVPANTRTLSAFRTALEHSFKLSSWFNDPKSRSDILIGKFCDAINPRLLSVVEIQDLTERTYFLTVEPARGKSWQPQFADKLRSRGLGSSLWQSGPRTRLTLAFPPYVDFWQVKTLALDLSNSVV